MKYLFLVFILAFGLNINAQKIFTFTGSDTIVNFGNG